MEVFSTDDLYVFNSEGLNPGNKILPRVAKFWSLDYVGEVFKVTLRGQEFYFSDRYIIPYSTESGAWISYTPEQAAAILSDPELLSRDISPTHREL